MKLTVVACPCGNPKPHFRLRDEDDGVETEGIFFVAKARGFLAFLVAEGRITQAESDETEAQLAATGAPEYRNLSEGEAPLVALEIIASFPPEKYGEAVDELVKHGLSPTDAEYLRELIGNPANLIPGE